MRYWTPKQLAHWPRVGIAVASYLVGDERRHPALECLVASIRAQSYSRWSMRIVHDGQADAEAKSTLEKVRTSDTRVRYSESRERLMKFGHPHRQAALLKLIDTDGCDWLLCTNDDNYYAPVFLEWLLSEALGTFGCKFVHCDMVHSHQKWRLLKTAPKYRHLDLGGFLVHASLVRKIPFNNFAFNGDGDWIDRLAAACDPGTIQRVPAVLFTHN